jgi:hypothetical protein
VEAALRRPDRMPAAVAAGRDRERRREVAAAHGQRAAGVAATDSPEAALFHDPARSPEAAEVHDRRAAEVGVDRIPPCVRQRKQETVRGSGRDRTVPAR